MTRARINLRYRPQIRRLDGVSPAVTAYTAFGSRHDSRRDTVFVDFPYRSVADFTGALDTNQNPLLLQTRARELYEATRSRGLLSLIRSRFGHKACLLRRYPGIAAGDSYDGGTQTVPIEAIIGSEGRCSDFDRQFHPTQRHTVERWVRIATARMCDRTLPPVDLIKLGDEYYVRDGHHRISVARALGEHFVDARVTVCR
jgi:hypothetical protein